MKKATLVILLLLLGTWGFTQLPLSLQTMMEKVIRQNRSIQVEREKWIADKQGVFRSNAGLGPTVEFAASGEYNVNNTSLELNTFEQGAASTQKIEENFATSMTHSIGPQLNYTLFDGGRGKGQYQQLQNTADLSKLQAQWYFDHTLLEATQLYLTIASMEQTLDILQSNIELSQER
ncbi:MAG: TolC family protein, partial [Bacteroidota bacterium]